MDVAASQMPGSVGEFGWAGAANTYYWVDPVEKLIGVLMSQNMMGFDAPELDFRVLAYQALVDWGWYTALATKKPPKREAFLIATSNS